MGSHWLLFFPLSTCQSMLVVDASDSALELMQGGEMPVISIHISVQSRLFLLNRASDDMKNQSAVIT